MNTETTTPSYWPETKNNLAYKALSVSAAAAFATMGIEFQRPRVRAHWGPNVEESISIFLEKRMGDFIKEHGQKVADDYVKGLQLLQGVEETVNAKTRSHNKACDEALQVFIATYFEDGLVELNESALNVVITPLRVLRVMPSFNPGVSAPLEYNGETDSISGHILFLAENGTPWMGQLKIDAAGSWNVTLQNQIDLTHPLVTGADNAVW